MADEMWEQQAKNVTTAVREITPEGIKLEFNYQGQTSGKVHAQTTGTTTVWAKPDGTSTWEDKLMGMTAAGEMFVAWGKGTGKMTSPGMSSWEGEMHSMSQSPGLAWLNNGKWKASGTADQAKGTSQGKFHPSK